MKKIALAVFIITFYACNQTVSQKETPKKTEGIPPVSSYYPKEKTKVLIVGTFHMSYPNMDYVKTEDDDQIDVLTEPKKSEITELVEYIKKFKPTKIAIEAWPRNKSTKELREYKLGKHRDKRSEDYQLGMRIAAAMKLDTIYAVDAISFADDFEKRDSVYTKQLFKDFDFESDDPYEDYFKKWMDVDNSLPKKANLLEYFKHMNSKESHQYGLGIYFTGDFRLDEHRGADILAIWWYSRNLRIFRNIQLIDHTKDDRILVIMGNGHASILRHMFEASPEFEFVEFDSLD